MSEPDSGHPGQDPWQRAIGAFDVLWQELCQVQRDYPTTLEWLRRLLNGGGHRRLTALYMLRVVEDEYTVALVKEVTNAYLSEGSRLEARETLDRLPCGDLRHLVPAAAWQLLEELGDNEYGNDYEYTWIASLFDELRLDDALPELVRRALASSDPVVRRAGERVREEYLVQP
jgi:hypothetical protein